MILMRRRTLCLLLLASSILPVTSTGLERNNHHGSGLSDKALERNLEKNQKEGLEKRSEIWQSRRPEVAFQVWYNGPQINYGKHPIRIPYRVVRLNKGGGYKVGLHAFIAPVRGLYIFHVHGLSGSKTACIRLKKNDDLIEIAHGVGAYDTMSLSSMIDLVRGDSVQVITCTGLTGSLQGSHTYQSFIGHLLR